MLFRSWGTLATMKKREDLVDFLDALLTQSEEVMLARRIRIAKLLLTGMSQLEIAQKLKVGLATVQTVDRSLRKNFSSYRPVLSSLYEQVRKKKCEGKALTFPESFTSLRKKYPLHFLLLNLLLEDL